jgi:proteasome lid subunit RPN8/RPN11
VLGAIYHSHVRSPPYPSQTDVNFARSWPGIEWLIVALAAGEEPETRSYLIDVDSAAIEEVPIGVKPG